jgi:hypothetical protein
MRVWWVLGTTSLCVVGGGVSARSPEQDGKYEAFATQYRGLKAEALPLWSFARKVTFDGSLTTDRNVLARLQELTEMMPRLHRLTEACMKWELSQDQAEIQGARRSPERDSMHVLFLAANELGHVVEGALDYLSERKGLCLEIALKHEEIWKSVESAMVKK